MCKMGRKLQLDQLVAKITETLLGLTRKRDFYQPLTLFLGQFCSCRVQKKVIPLQESGKGLYMHSNVKYTRAHVTIPRIKRVKLTFPIPFTSSTIPMGSVMSVPECAHVIQRVSLALRIPEIRYAYCSVHSACYGSPPFQAVCLFERFSCSACSCSA